MTFRVEKKFRVSVSEFFVIRELLLSNGMSLLHDSRQVHSLYYDTQGLQMFYDSEDGVVPRKKVRLRWYNSAPESTVESKFTSIEGRFKSSYKSDKIHQSTDEFPRDMLDNLYGVIRPALLVSYRREYYSYRGLRVTFDSSIRYQDETLSLKRPMDDPERVVEIKSDINTSDDFISELLPISISRFSKYSRGVSLTRGFNF